MKKKNDEIEKKTKRINEKYNEKDDRLKLIEENNKKITKQIVKRIQKKEKLQGELIIKKNEDHLKYRTLREEIFVKNKMKKQEIRQLDKNRRDNILYGEFYIFDRLRNQIDMGESQRKYLKNKTIEYYKEEEELRKECIKKLNSLQCLSVGKKTDKQKRKIYNEKLRKEAEERKRAEEDAMEGK